MPAPLLSKDEVIGRLMRVFRTFGYSGATLARFSEATGLGKASLYHHFPGGKEELFHAMVTAHVKALAQRVDEALAGAATPIAGIEASTAVVVEYFNEHRAFFQIFYAAQPGGRAHVQSNLRGDALSAFEKSRRKQIEVVRAAQRAGQVRTDLPAEELVDFRHAVTMVTLARWAMTRSPAGRKEQIDLLWKLQQGGMCGGRR